MLQAWPSEPTLSPDGAYLYVQVDYQTPVSGQRFPMVLQGWVFQILTLTGQTMSAFPTSGAFPGDYSVPLLNAKDGTVLYVDEVPNPNSTTGFPQFEFVAYTPPNSKSWSLQVPAAAWSAVATTDALRSTTIVWSGANVSAIDASGNLLWNSPVSLSPDPGYRGNPLLVISEDRLSVFITGTNAPNLLQVKVADGSSTSFALPGGFGTPGFSANQRMLSGADGSLYVCSSGDYFRGTINPVLALNADLSIKWANPAAALSPPCVLDTPASPSGASTLYGTGRNQIIAVNAQTGAVLWTAPTSGAGVRSLVLGVAGQLIAIDGNGTFMSIGQAPAASNSITPRDFAAAGVGAGISVTLCAGIFAVWWFKCRTDPRGPQGVVASWLPKEVGGTGPSLQGFYTAPSMAGGAGSASGVGDAYDVL